MAALEEEVSHSVLTVLKSASDARGSYRKEAYLAALEIYFRNQTNRPCYTEMSLILDCVAASCGRDDAKTDPENIRRTCERYLNGQDAVEKAGMVLAVMFKQVCNDRFSVNLRERLLATTAPVQLARRTRTATKSKQMPS